MTDEQDPKDQHGETEDREQPAAVDSSEQASTPEVESDSRRDAIGAYLLDALPDEERRDFESFLATSPEAQAELRQLAPVVALLPSLFELESEDQEAAPDADLRERLMQAAETEQPAGAVTDTVDEPTETSAEMVEAADDDAPVTVPLANQATDSDDETRAAARARTIRTSPQETGPFEHKRRAGAAPAPRPLPEPLATITRIPAPWLLAAGLTIIAAGAIIWALALQGRIDSKNREIAAQSERLAAQTSEIAQLRQSANATAFTLSASEDQAESAGGTLLYSLRDNIGVLYVRDLPELDDDRVYQLWYLDDDRDAPLPGGTFRVDANGQGFIVVEPNTQAYDGLAVTEEPEGGSQAPTTAIVLLGQLGGAAG